MLKYVRILQKAIIFLLLFVMVLILLVSTVNIILTVVSAAVSDPREFFTADQLQSLFGLFLVILIGIELLDTVKAFLKEEEIHVEIVLLVAIIAIARKVIVWDFSEYEVEQLFSLSAMLLALALSYGIIKGTWTKVILEKIFAKGKRKEIISEDDEKLHH
ncbi:phosphate-starvation-inducible PsiE family protein [Marinilabilia rubra]|uniref:Phosphate-starvation-inducible E-like protein n=1 Tax=Marinilabilia rubra TaxID=2162893 RepID=A0A2U2B751_9BACT|nr:phosphate-starvation-inducible PsiE family protein [Marinilabilia rubra]PWD98863.1 hypothetical protein DDZ16_13495 [Marinilabilia rubra]